MVLRAICNSVDSARAGGSKSSLGILDEALGDAIISGDTGQRMAEEACWPMRVL